MISYDMTQTIPDTRQTPSDHSPSPYAYVLFNTVTSVPGSSVGGAFHARDVFCGKGGRRRLCEPKAVTLRQHSGNTTG